MENVLQNARRSDRIVIGQFVDSVHERLNRPIREGNREDEAANLTHSLQNQITTLNRYCFDEGWYSRNETISIALREVTTYTKATGSE